MSTAVKSKAEVNKPLIAKIWIEDPTKPPKFGVPRITDVNSNIH